MTIERIVLEKGKVKERTTLIPGYVEQIAPKALKDFFSTVYTKVDLGVADDDTIDITFQDCYPMGERGTQRTTRFTEHGINEHRPSYRTAFGREVLFQWVRSTAQLSVEEEEAIADMVKKLGYSKERETALRDRLILDNQRNRQLRRT